MASAARLRLTASEPIYASSEDSEEYLQAANFGDAEWNLAARNTTPSASARVLLWKNVPAKFQYALKCVVWLMLNQGLPEELASRRGRKFRRLPSAGTIAGCFYHWVHFTRWLEQNDITSFSRVTSADLRQYEASIVLITENGKVRGTYLSDLTRLSALTKALQPKDRLSEPPWIEMGIEIDVAAASASNANSTVPVHPSTMSPLLIWSIRFVEDFSDDILRAASEKSALYKQPRKKWPGGPMKRARDFFISLKENGLTGPGRYVSARSEIVPATTYLAYRLNVDVNLIYQALKQVKGIEWADCAPLKVVVRGRVHDKPWLDFVDFHDVEKYLRLLETACLIVIAYLSGMRPEEVLSLQKGSMRIHIASSGRTARYQIVSTTFKGVLSIDGDRSQPGGRTRDDPWTVLAIVAKAIEVSEKLSPTQFLFPSNLRSSSKRSGSAASPKAAISKIEVFIKWVNEYAERMGLAPDCIPPDPFGAVTLRRFRRTLAWYIARQPGGRVALGVQYGHLRLYVSEGYGGRAASGLQHVVAVEDARALADRLQLAVQRLNDGESVSGPAALRYIGGVQSTAPEYAGRFLTDRQLLSLQRNSSFRIYDNATQFLHCVYDPALALCSKSAKSDAMSTPSLNRCNTACANVARTDHDLSALENEVAALKKMSRSLLLPEPLRNRYKHRLQSLQQIARRHRRDGKR